MVMHSDQRKGAYKPSLTVLESPVDDSLPFFGS